MKNYVGKTQEQLVEVTCNRCGRKMRVENGILKEGCYSSNTLFGYYSRKDGTRQMFDLCEDCYDAVTKAFVIPVTEIEESELC
ncbi:MAG TPA: hypothetical protein VJY54_01580 [Lachnospiraceae bacterium]|nr:hypothetical protein [Lachnospiraceae bacterium]